MLKKVELMIVVILLYIYSTSLYIYCDFSFKMSVEMLPKITPGISWQLSTVRFVGKNVY